jgi:hypothetical protein
MIVLFLSIVLNYTILPYQQEKNFWQVLAEVSFKKESRDGYEVEVPQFSKYLKSWNGKKVKIKGFIIPVGEVGDASKFMFSSLPFNVCYFCGAAGPETIMEVETNQKIKFTSQSIWMEGILILNEKDPEHHMYILKSATVINP